MFRSPRRELTLRADAGRTFGMFCAGSQVRLRNPEACSVKLLARAGKELHAKRGNGANPRRRRRARHH